MTSRRKIWLVLLIPAIALVGFAAFMAGFSSPPPPGVHVLPDGSVLTLGAVSFGTNRTLRQTATTGWRKRLLDVVPNYWSARLGWTSGGGSITLGGDPGQTNLLLSTICRMKPPASFPTPRLQVFDDAGNLFDSVEVQGSVGTYGGKQMTRMDAWCLPAFPRRGAKLGLRLLTESNHVWRSVAEFSIPNPAQGNYPIWRPEPLPNTQRNGDLSMTLVSLKSGLASADHTRAAKSGEAAGMEMIFDLRREPVFKADQWEVAGVTISDATGNRWAPSWVEYTPPDGTGRGSLFCHGALWPGEAAWKLRFELAPLTDFPKEEMVTIGGLPIPTAKDDLPLNWSTNLAGGQMELLSLTGYKVDESRYHDTFEERARLRVTAKLAGGPDRRIRLVGITDDQGRAVTGIKRAGDRAGLDSVFGFYPPVDAKALTATFALPASRYVEFLTHPDFPAK